MPRNNAFIPPMLPSPAKTPPEGPEWLHEAKLDGFRGQIHVADGAVALFSRNGVDLTKRFKSLRPVLQAVRAKSAIIDCEIVACGDNGMPCFRTLLDNDSSASLCLWAFDLLALDGVRVMPLPLRRALLAELVGITSHERLQCSGEFEDPAALLIAGEKTGLEGVVSKRRDSAYRPGRTNDWLKVKTLTWRDAHRDRFELLLKKR
jgi:bifunctional non-homologous end joining protein LigD